MLSIQNLSFRHNRDIFSQFNLKVNSGDFLYLRGENGAGKTSLLRIIAGLVPGIYPGEVEGTISFDNGSVRSTVLCLTGPWAASRLFCRTVWEEISFSPSSSKKQALSLLRYFGIEKLKHKHPQSLSGGEQQIVLICAYFSCDPDLILLDESFAPLSQKISNLLVDLIIEKHQKGKTIILVEHCLPEKLGRYVRHIKIGLDEELSQKNHCSEIDEISFQSVNKTEVLSVQNLIVNVSRDKQIQYEDFQLCNSELMHLNGVNGSGKTTLFRALTGLNAFRGDIRFKNQDLKEYDHGELSRKISVVLQSPDSQFFCNTVKHEICYSANLFKSMDVDYFDYLCKSLQIRQILDQNPFTLSHGEKKKCQLAASLLIKPEILILDEPDAHLDINSMTTLVNLLKNYLLNGGSVLFTSHSPDFLNLLNYSSMDVISYNLKGCQNEI